MDVGIHGDWLGSVLREIGGGGGKVVRKKSYMFPNTNRDRERERGVGEREVTLVC